MQRSLAGSTLNPRSRDFGTPGRAPSLADPADSRPVGFKGGERRKLNHQLPNLPGSLPNTRTLLQGTALAPVGTTDPDPAEAEVELHRCYRLSVPGRYWEGGTATLPFSRGFMSCHDPSAGAGPVV